MKHGEARYEVLAPYWKYWVNIRSVFWDPMSVSSVFEFCYYYIQSQ